MSDDAIRWVMAAGVILGAFAVVGQMAIMLGLYRIAREMHGRLVDIAARVLPLLEQTQPKIVEITEEAAAIAAATRRGTERMAVLTERMARILRIVAGAAAALASARRVLRARGLRNHPRELPSA